MIRVESADFSDLTLLVSDLLGEPQELPPGLVDNLARWVLRYGRHTFGECFTRGVAERLIWSPSPGTSGVSE